MDKKLKKIFKNRDFWLAIIIVVWGFSTGFFNDLFNPPNIARLEVDYGDAKRAFEGEIMFKEMFVLDALLASSRGGNFEVRYAIVDDQTEILKINGLVEDGLNEKSWNFYLNGQKIKSSEIHKIRIKPGDKILVRFE